MSVVMLVLLGAAALAMVTLSDLRRKRRRW